MFTYLVDLVRVVDGDTVDFNVDLGFYLKQKMRIRLKGVNTPEVRGKDREKGLISKSFVEEELSSAKIVGIKSYKIGKYGRFIADVFYSKRKIKSENIFQKKYSLNEALIKNKLAKRTKGK